VGSTARGPRLQLAQARREAVPDPLQRAQIGQAGTGGVSPGGSGRCDEGKAIGDDLRELLLEPRDLGSERGTGGQLALSVARQGLRQAADQLALGGCSLSIGCSLALDWIPLPQVPLGA
jgi:hypothetical protein